MNKKIGLLLTVLALAIFSIVFVSAAGTVVTVKSPITWSNNSGTLNVSVLLNNAYNATSNVTFYCNKTGGAVDDRLAGDIVATISPDATGLIFENAAVSLTTYTDGLSYNCSAYADNQTEQIFSVASKNITIDSTSPVCSISVSYPLIHKDGPQYLTWSITDALSLVGSNTYVNRPSPGTQLSYTSVSATSLFLSGINTTYVGDWGLSAYGIDRAGNTCNATTTFVSDQPGGTVTIEDGISPEQPNYGMILLIIAVVIALVVIFSNKR